jgi:DNA-binding transcriptional LysR family regulator
VFELFPGETEPLRVIEADSESVIVNLVQTGVGISLIRDELATQLTASRRGVIWPGRSVTTKLWLVYDAAREDDPLLSALREVLCEVWERSEGAAPARPV